MKNIMRSGFLALIALSAACQTIEAGNIAVLTEYGKVEGTYPPGTYWDGPMMEFKVLSTRTQSFNMIGTPPATSDSNHEQNGEGTVTVLTRDQLSVNIDCTIQFHLNPEHAIPIYTAFGMDYAQTVIHSPARAAIRDSAGHFIAMDLVDRREALQQNLESEIRMKIHTMLRQQRVSTNAIVLDAVLVRAIDLPNSLDESIANLQRERMQTQQRQQSALTAFREAERQAAEARGNAERNLILARSASETKRIEAEAEANSNRIIGSSLSPQVLHLRAIEAQRSILANNQTRVVFMPPNMNLFNMGNMF